MKKLWFLLFVVLLLTGCSAEETFETVNDALAVPASAIVYEVSLGLPDEASKQTIRQDMDVLYVCDNYILTVQKLDGGDLQGTVKQISGFDKEDLTMIRTVREGFPCWHLTWTTSGEEEPQVCRAVILDDGAQHHVVTVMAEASVSAQLAEQWQNVLSTVALISTG